MSTWYILLLTLVALVQVGVCITAFKMKNEVEETLELNMKETIPNYNEQNKALSYTWNSLQLNLMCCGVNDYKDWKLNEVMGYDKANKVPDACCINTKQGCGSYTDIGTIYSQGCLPKLKTLIDDNALVLAFLAGIFVFIQIAGIVFASCLAFSLKKDYESMK